LLELEEALKPNSQDISTAEEQTVQIEQNPTQTQQTPKNTKHRQTSKLYWPPVQKRRQPMKS